MIIAIPAETAAGEKRVALVPESVQRLAAKQWQIRLQSGAGTGACFSDDDYRRAGAGVETSVVALFDQADLIVKVRSPSAADVERFRRGAALICLLYPRLHSAAVRTLVARGVTAIALENMPRSTVAQAMDVLSSQSTVAGYRAVIVAAAALAKFVPMLMTPAGTIAPARLLVVGAGVAGLQAIATARRLGAVVEAFDVRLAARTEVESLGAKFIEPWLEHTAETAAGYARELTEAALGRARNALRQPLAHADVCITTALVPNRRAPILLTKDMIENMRPGAVIVDLAAEQGGNCELTEAGKDIDVHGVKIIGRSNLVSEMAPDASRMFSRNLEKVIDHFINDERLRIDFGDEIARCCVVTHDGAVAGAELRQALALAE